MKHDDTVDFDLEKTPLEIKTDSVLGNNEMVRVNFHTANHGDAGGVILKFRTLQYIINECTSWTNLPTALPSSVNKVWRISLNRDSGIRLKITCNGKHVLDLLMSGTTCSISRWSQYWKNDAFVKKIMFMSDDNASDGYRPG